MHRSSTILIVDDNESGRKTIDNLLYGSGYNLIFAENGFEALEKAETCLPDLILLDVMMPGMDGFEVCRRLRANPLVSEIPILIVTMLDDNDSRLQGLNAGADDFISKPFNSAELEARVNTITRLNRYRRLVSERNKLEWALNQADSGFIILDSDGIITFSNILASKYLDAQSNGEENNHFISLVKSRFQLEPEDLWQQWIEGNSPDYGELILVKPETEFSKKQWLKVSYLIEHVDKQSRQVLKFTDVTHQVTTSYNIRTFIATVSHKLRTPLTSMIMNYEMFAKSNGLTRNEDAISIKEDIENLRVAVEDVLAYSQASLLAYSGWNITFEDIKNIIKGILTNREIETFTINIDKKLDKVHFPIADLPLTIIIEELAENAKKFHPQMQPEIEVDIKIINTKTISLTFSDDGINLPPEHLSNLLIPFYQAEKEFTGGTGGMGLGLPIVASIVWEIGGKCRIKNRLNRPGICVELILPITDDHSA